MSATRIPTGLSGILALDKPAGLTSHDVVARVRGLTGERRVGHAGTLDPMATGLLLVLVGPATRLASYLSDAAKRYVATVRFGAETDTDDAEGTITERNDVPSVLADYAFAETAVAGLVGPHDQIPPAYSAVKVDGRTGYERARRGEDVQLAPRRVEVLSAVLLNTRPDPVEWNLELEVTKGTYIRSIARDLGRDLGTHAHLSALRRIFSGRIGIDDAMTLDALETVAAAGQDAITLGFTDPVRALDLQVHDCDAAAAARVGVGGALSVPRAQLPPGLKNGPVALRFESRLLAIYEIKAADAASSDLTVSDAAEQIVLKPLAVIPGGVRTGTNGIAR